MAKNQNIALSVEEIIKPMIESLGYKLWDTEFVKEGAGWYLRLTIDSENGILIEDCEKVSRAVSPLLDEADPIEQNYTLEVSSPGIERVLKKPEHFSVCIGEKIEVRLYSPDETGSKAYTGILKSTDGNILVLGLEDKEKTFEISKIAKANVHFDFTDI